MALTCPSSPYDTARHHWVAITHHDTLLFFLYRILQAIAKARMAMLLLRARDDDATELLDAEAGDPAALRDNLRDIRHINALLGWTSFTRRSVARHVRQHGLASFSLLDVASGSADIPLAVAHWAEHAGVTA